MVFEAKGRLERIVYKGGISEIRAIMHEGWLGSNHKIRLILDKKFTEDVQRELGFNTESGLDRKGKLKKDKYQYLGLDLQRQLYKDVLEHEIIIIIK